MKIATWNVNSIRVRQERVLAWAADKRPDVLCLQELKAEDAKFPTLEFEGLGYHVATFGQKTYNGVAILSRAPLTDIERGFADGGDESQSRFIAGTLNGIRIMSVYVPNGQSVGSEKYNYKLAWMERLRAYLGARIQPDAPAALCGDFNVAPADLDVHDPAAWEGQIHCSKAERSAFFRLEELGLVDLVRKLHPEQPLFTWWDYRMLAFPKNAGLRIDHILVTPALLERATGTNVDREARKGKQPSDHAPVTAEFDD
jgi:exodeoxyribonuclease III